jgi:ribonuclease Z
MPRLIILGTASAIPDQEHENTHMIIVGDKRSVLIDCVSSPLLRLQEAGLDMLNLTDLFLTHFHPDHVSGVPPLLMQSWLLGRKDKLGLYGIAHTLDRVEKMMDSFGWASWPGFYPVHINHLPEKEMALALESDEIRIYTSPVHHLIPTIGLRIEFPLSGKVLAYSCDTEPCDEVIRLAHAADLLIHEATGAFQGHTAASQAGEIARKAGAGELLLIHYDPRQDTPEKMILEANTTFQGPVSLAEDFMTVDF